jgi:hypothetical protein
MNYVEAKIMNYGEAKIMRTNKVNQVIFVQFQKVPEILHVQELLLFNPHCWLCL